MSQTDKYYLIYLCLVKRYVRLVQILKTDFVFAGEINIFYDYAIYMGTFLCPFSYLLSIFLFVHMYLI